MRLAVEVGARAAWPAFSQTAEGTLKAVLATATYGGSAGRLARLVSNCGGGGIARKRPRAPLLQKSRELRRGAGRSNLRRLERDTLRNRRWRWCGGFRRLLIAHHRCRRRVWTHRATAGLHLKNALVIAAFGVAD